MLKNILLPLKANWKRYYLNYKFYKIRSVYTFLRI
jgi:hypothetical protein